MRRGWLASGPASQGVPGGAGRMGQYGQAAGCGLAQAGRRQTPRVILLEPLNA